MPGKTEGEKERGMKIVSWGSKRPGPEDEKVGHIWKAVYHVDKVDVIVKWVHVPDPKSADRKSKKGAVYPDNIRPRKDDFVVPMGGVPRGDLED